MLSASRMPGSCLVHGTPKIRVSKMLNQLLPALLAAVMVRVTIQWHKASSHDEYSLFHKRCIFVAPCISKWIACHSGWSDAVVHR